MLGVISSIDIKKLLQSGVECVAERGIFVDEHSLPIITIQYSEGGPLDGDPHFLLS